ncbi:hypothetical protein DL95DRAFT_527156 [Leptodontidium sp. 2 PMI_412]|nr:hypothetical protein DL95DRAFT_527156 [Leptodontidium sp. 2 PMI_412]
MSLLYYVDDEGFLEDPFDGLLKIPAKEVPDSWGKILMFIVRLHEIYIKFKKIWDSTVGELISMAGRVIDNALGGLLTSLGQILETLKNDIIALVAEELLTEADIFGWFSLKMRKGFDEQAFAKKMIDDGISNENTLGQEHGEQLLAFALGWVCHVGTDVIAHSFVNEQCGGPFRTHWQHHHLIENHIDAYNYECTGNGILPPDDFCGWQPSYQSVADSALYFAYKGGDLRQPLPEDDGDFKHEEDRKKLLDTDGALPDWLADTIAQTFIEVCATKDEGGKPELQDTKTDDVGGKTEVPHPMNLKGQSFQEKVNKDTALIAYYLDLLEIPSIPIQLEDLRKIIAKDPLTENDEGSDFKTPEGFPFPWEIKAAYRFMLSWFKRSFMSTWNMPCPQPPKVYMPPLVPDIPLPVPPDFSGVNPDDEPIVQGCEVLAAILDWFVKQIEEIGKFIYDWIKSIASMITYPLREEIYEHSTLPMWEAGESIRMVLCHLRYIMPQSAQDWAGTNDMKFPTRSTSSSFVWVIRWIVRFNKHSPTPLMFREILTEIQA